MHKKLIICTVFLIVTQSSVLLSSAVFTRFSDDALAILEEFTSQDLAARFKVDAGLTGFFDLLENGAAQTNTKPFYEALSLTADSIVIVFNATIPILDDCEVFETALNESLQEASEVIHELISSIELAHGGNYEENRSGIEGNRSLTETGLQNTFKPLFDLLRCCASDTSYEYESLIDDVQQKTNENVEVITKAIYKAIEAYGIITTECTEEEAEAAAAAIEESRACAIAANIDNIEVVLSLFETRWVNIYINESSISHEIYAVRLGRKKLSDQWVEVLRLVFLEINVKLLGHAKDVIVCDVPANLTGITESSAIRTLQDAKDLFLDEVSYTLPYTHDQVTVTRVILRYVLPLIINNWYYGIGLAEAEILHLHLALLGIESVEGLQRLLSNLAVESDFENFDNDGNDAVRLAELEETVTNGLQRTNYAVFAAIEVLAKAARATDGATQQDWDEIEILWGVAIYEINIAVRFLFAANLRTLILLHGY